MARDTCYGIGATSPYPKRDPDASARSRPSPALPARRPRLGPVMTAPAIDVDTAVIEAFDLACINTGKTERCLGTATWVFTAHPAGPQCTDGLYCEACLAVFRATFDWALAAGGRVSCAGCKEYFTTRDDFLRVVRI